LIWGNTAQRGSLIHLAANPDICTEKRLEQIRREQYREVGLWPEIPRAGARPYQPDNG
jgi:hypothetical protein